MPRHPSPIRRWLRLGPPHVGRARFLLRRLDALHLAFEVMPALLLTAMAGATLIWWRTGMPGGLAWLRLVLDPAIASILFVVAVALVPDLCAGRRIRFPLPMTLPVVYLGLLVGMKLLTEGSRAGILKFAESARLDGYWLHPSFLILVGGLQASVLAIAAMRASKRKP